MDDTPYKCINTGGLILRDYLALDRTVLANERTLLSYVRTAIAFAGAGAALVHFFKDTLIQMLGWVLIPIAVVMIVIGFTRFHRMKRRLEAVNKNSQAWQS